MTDQGTQPFLATSRRGRPQRFADVIGQEHIAGVLQGALERGKVSHAYLFSGPRGVGKTSTARILAKALNCERGTHREPCNECRFCKSITAGNFIDCIEIDAASNTGVENIRDLREAVRFTPAVGRTKVYIIDEVHMLSTAAFNALLKTLEEPPEHCKFILATTEEHKVPETILSRCQRFHFRCVTVVQIIENLKRVYSEEIKTLDIPEAVFSYVARAARGSIRDSQSLMDQIIAFSDEQVTLEDVESLLGAVEFDVLLEFIRKVHEGNAGDALTLIDEISQRGRDLGQFVRDLVELYRHLLVAQYASQPARLIDLAPEQLAATVETASKIKTETLLRALEVLFEAEGYLKSTVDARLVVELAAFKMALLTESVSLRDLIARVEGWGGETLAPAPARPDIQPPAADSTPARTPPAAKSVPAREETKEERKPDPPAARIELVQESAAPPLEIEAPPETQDEEPAQPVGRIEMIDPDSGIDPRLWKIFLENLEERSMRLASYLHAAQALSLADNRLSIAIPKVHRFHYDELKKPVNHREVEKLLGEVFERKIRVDWVLKEIEVLTDEDAPPEAELTPTQLIDEASRDPHVQQVVDLFSGVVVDRKIQRSRKPSSGEANVEPPKKKGD